MQKYYICLERNSHDEYEIHAANCPRLQRGTATEYLGEFKDCHGALSKAIALRNKVNGCAWCCFSCHSLKFKIDTDIVLSE